MQQTISVCDLPHETVVAAVAEVQVLIDQSKRRMDVCSEHLTFLDQLPAVQESSSRDTVRASGAAAATASSGRSRRSSTSSVARATSGRRAPGSRRALQEERAAVREWARAQGRAVGDKGRLPAGLVEEYREASGS